MKKKLSITLASVILLFVLIIFYTFNSCKKNVDSIRLSSVYVISGKVVNDETSLPLSNAMVYCLEENTTTNSEGIYKFYFKELPNDFIKISAKKEGYPMGTTIITLENYYSVNTIRLIPPAISTIIDSSGGDLSIENNESIDPTQTIKIEFPADALSSSTEISMTPLEGIKIPDISPRKTLGLLNAATVSFEPSGLTLNKNATVSFPLPMKMDEGEELELLVYNEESLAWELSGVKATVDATGSTATTEINHFSTYSIGIQGDYTETMDNATLSDSPIDIGTDSLYCYQATVEYPNGVPDDVSLNWMKNAVSQNTELGGRISFFDPTCISVKTVAVIKSSNIFNLKDSDSDCKCPDLGDPPCEECETEEYNYTCRATVYENLSYIYSNGWTSISRSVDNYITFEKIIKCKRWKCPDDCHEGGGGK